MEADTSSSSPKRLTSIESLLVTMVNAPTLADEPVAQRRVSSSTSTVSSEGEESSVVNPLLKLVDAASQIDAASQLLEPMKKTGAEAPTMDNDASTSSVGNAEAAKLEPPEAPKVEETKEAQVPSTSTSTATTGTTAAKAEKSPPVNIIAGTKEDLIMSPNMKMSFSEQLYNVLEDENHHDVLQWMPDGRSFTIVNHKKFTLDKMPKLFNIRNMSSFVRKLGRWGFSRVHEKATNNSDIFKHPEFVRHERENVKRRVKCLGRAMAARNNSAGSSSAAAPQHHPNHPHNRQMGGVPPPPRQPDFVVPSKGGPMIPLNNRFMDYRNDHHHHHHRHHSAGPAHHHGFGGPSDFSRSTSTGSAAGHPSMDKVTAASAASAEALYLCHQQQQQARMEQLAMEQQELEDREIQTLMKQRAMRQRQRLAEQQQQRLFVADHRSGGVPLPPPQASVPPAIERQMSIERQLSPSSSSQSLPSSEPNSSAVSSPLRHGMANNEGGMMADHQRDGGVSSPGQEGGPRPIVDRVQVPPLQHQQQLHQPKPQAMMGGPLNHSPGGRSSFVDVRQAYGASVGRDSPPRHVSPGGELSRSASVSYDTDELRSVERQAAIRALLREEQEWEANRRATSLGQPRQHPHQPRQQQRRLSYNSSMQGGWTQSPSQQPQQQQQQPHSSMQQPTMHGTNPPLYR